MKPNPHLELGYALLGLTREEGKQMFSRGGDAMHYALQATDIAVEIGRLEEGMLPGCFAAVTGSSRLPYGTYTIRQLGMDCGEWLNGPHWDFARAVAERSQGFIPGWVAPSPGPAQTPHGQRP